MSVYHALSYENIDKNKTIRFKNKKHPQKMITLLFEEISTMYEIKQKIFQLFHKNIKNKITGFRLVTKGPPDDDLDDTISDNFFEDKYNSTKVSEVKKTIEDKCIYDKVDDILVIYFRAIMLTLPITIIKSQINQTFEFPLSFEDNPITKFISYIEEQTHIQIDEPYHIFQNNENLEKISKKADMKEHSKTGLIIFIFPIQVDFIFKSTNRITKINIDSNKPLSNFLGNVFESLSIQNDPIIYSYNIKNDDENIDINLPIIHFLRKQKNEALTFEIYERKKESEDSNRTNDASFFMNRIRYLEASVFQFCNFYCK